MNKLEALQKTFEELIESGHEDPFSYSLTMARRAIEWALDQSGSMNEYEASLLAGLLRNIDAI